MSTLLQLADAKLIIDNYNNDFLIVKLADEDQANSSKLNHIGKAIFQAKFDFIEEVIVTEIEICLKLNSLFTPSKIEDLQQVSIETNTNIKTYKLPIYFSKHEDWKLIESLTGFTKDEVIQKLTATHFSIGMFGFLPGFIYFNGLDKSLHLPRKSVPSKYIEANSIAIGGQYLGLYSIESPGGWYVIGRIPTSILNLPNIPPINLNLEDKVQLYAIDKTTYEQLRDY